MTFQYLAHVPYVVLFLVFSALLLVIATVRPAARPKPEEPTLVKTRRATGTS